MENERLEREADRAHERARSRDRKRQTARKMPVHGRSVFVLQAALAKRAERKNPHPSMEVKRALVTS